MCRSHSQSGGGRSHRRCKGKGTVGAAYTSERLAKSVGADASAEIPTYSEAYKEEKEALSKIQMPEPPAGEEYADPNITRSTDYVDPQSFDNFHRVVNKMITKSDMTDHDKRIARKQWNSTKEDVERGEVTYAQLAAWQKVMAATALVAANKIPDENGNTQKMQWQQMNRVLRDREPIENVSYDSVVSAPGYDSREEFEKDFPAVDAPEAPATVSEPVAAPSAPAEPVASKPAPRVSSQASAVEDDDDDDDAWTGSSRDDEYADSGHDSYGDDDDNEDGFNLDAELAGYDDLFKDSINTNAPADFDDK